MNNLQSVLDLLQGPGEPMSGCALTADEAHIYMREHFPRQAYCLVRDWSLFDDEQSAGDQEFGRIARNNFFGES